MLSSRIRFISVMMIETRCLSFSKTEQFVLQVVTSFVCDFNDSEIKNVLKL